MADRGLVALDLVPPELIVPRLRVAGAVFAVVGAVLGVVAGLLISPFVGVALGAALVATAGFAVVSGGRRRVWIDHGVVSRRGSFRVRRVNLSDATKVEVLVRVARVSQVLIRVGDSSGDVTVGVAMYTSDGGRELQPIALRAVADGLASSPLAPALALSSVLVTQLRAEAREAGLSERPLYRAIDVVRTSGRAPATVLTDAEVAALTD
ncbi:hypothetical protein HQ325_20835 [Rhodococcus sp. BP-349]|uniref:hypothetical protein n=1 Tax=unclassified Rhodococcus (in: high G+C Gram-positive bacteria) TaxID=192944 RepID=UPI001C9B23FE|nr:MULTISPECIES: hypothetical protein [unclassified Rhodococcus (in: high G+C Gram-positive bacteria)]MBY6541117.1 hypothetical protein [Rhodococcus sp. BP-363]MBY6544857.1 hypothetical protein [Rhodococcus sp. BP-369]MBY6564087.1 hypothetical protein [Rhodococcus sp. BP-370]MBY6578976.1 hypothetical protein [Rhodococcus sp. BP-364]MBY6588277.1 hypothetical protein [Rhodococcus sp. BP-358]